MRTFCLIFVLILLPASLSAEDLRVALKREADRCAAVWQKNDLDGIVSYLPPRVVKDAGGPTAMANEIRAQFAQAKSLGAEWLEIKTGAAPVPKQTGKLLAAVVPLTAIVHGARLDLTQQTHALAVSSDQGKSWSFMLLYQMTQADLNAWFPEFRGAILVPPTTVPRVEVVF